MISARVGNFFDKPLSKIAKKIQLNPNILTLTGFLLIIISAVIIPVNIKLAGIIIAIGSLFDMFDGVVARINGRVTKFGAFLDSVLDRYSDAFIFFGLVVFFLKRNEFTGVYLCLLNLIGSFLVSYTRARAEGMGYACHVGIMERPERIIFLIVATITGWLKPILWIMLILTHFTVFERIYHVWRVTKKHFNNKYN